MSYRKSREIAPEVLGPETFNESPFHLDGLKEELHLACWNENIDKIKSILETKEAKHYNFVNETDAGGQNLLHLVAFWGSLQVAELLVGLNIDVNAVNVQKQRPLDVALMWGHVE